MLSSKKIKFFTVVGTFTIISTAYMLHAKTFYKELYPTLSDNTTVEKLKVPIKEKVTIEVVNIVKAVEPKENVEVIEKVVQKSIKIASEPKKNLVSPSDKLNQILKEDKYLHIEKSGEISSHSKEILKKIIPLLSDIKYSYIELEGHSSSQIYHDVTKKTSEQSAQKIHDYLKDKIVNRKIVVTGYGDLYPILDDKKDMRNSRVELKIRRR